VLTVKYSKGVISEGSRLQIPRQKTMYGSTLAETADKVDQIAEIANEIECSTAQLAIAWTVTNTNVATAILGAKSLAQLDENLDAAAFIDKITPEVRAKIDAIVDLRPTTLPCVRAHSGREVALRKRTWS